MLKGLQITILQKGGYQDLETRVERAARKLVALTVSTRMSNTMRLTIKLRSTTLKSSIKMKVGGLAHNPGKHSNVKAKQFVITLRRELETAALLKVLAHEIKHVEQFATGRLRIGTKAGRVGYFWRAAAGPAVFYPTSSDYSTYRAWPWEVEARAHEATAVAA